MFYVCNIVLSACLACTVFIPVTCFSVLLYILRVLFQWDFMSAMRLAVCNKYDE